MNPDPDFWPSGSEKFGPDPEKNPEPKHCKNPQAFVLAKVPYTYITVVKKLWNRIHDRGIISIVNKLGKQTKKHFFRSVIK